MDQSFIVSVYEGFEYERSRKEPPEDFPALPPIPGGRYTDPEFLELESRIGLERIPKQLRMTPRLSGMIERS